MPEPIPQWSRILRALERFQTSCMHRLAREEVYGCWIAHYLMLEFGVGRVIAESHHDGRGLSSSLRCDMQADKQSWLRKPSGTGGAFVFDITLAKQDDVNACTFQNRFPDYLVASIEERRRKAAMHLLSFDALIEIKVVDSARKILTEDRIAKDVVKLAATSSAIREFSANAPVPLTALVVLLRDNHDLPPAASGVFKKVDEWGSR